jgi:methionine-rich copper-binding protein CopC
VKRFAPIVLALAAAATASPSISHPLPRAASPAPNAVLAKSPSEIRITFSEGLVAAFSGLDLKDATGHALALGPSLVDPQDHKQLAATIKTPLAPGTYVASWHAVGDDTHHVSGHYSFEIKP